VQHRRVRTNGIELHCAVAGRGPLVLLLHGFPEGWRSWEPTIPALVDAGYRVVAPDLRGYGTSDVPRGGYDMETLADDVRGLASAFLQEEGADGPSGGKVRLVGHDWGGALTWVFAYRHPDVLARAALLNAPHPWLFARRVFRRKQLRLSWYMFFFQLPRLPEAWLRRGGLRWAYRTWGASRDALSDGEQAAREEEMLRPGVLRGALAWYRTAFRRGPLAARAYAGVTEAELLLLWGERDGCLGVGLLDGIERHAHNLRLIRLPSAGHWLQREATEEVSAALSEFLEPGRGR